MVLVSTLSTLFTFSACATAHPPCPDVDAAVVLRDAGPSPCGERFVDEGDACVWWRAVPAPPCAPMALVRMGDDVAVHCANGMNHVLVTTSDTWDWREGAATVVEQRHDETPPLFEPRLTVTFPDGSRVATHGDVYAAPAAWRTDAHGAWRDTIPPPSAFLALGARLSDHEALFVGRDAFVFTIVQRDRSR